MMSNRIAWAMMSMLLSALMIETFITYHFPLEGLCYILILALRSLMRLIELRNWSESRIEPRTFVFSASSATN